MSQTSPGRSAEPSTTPRTERFSKTWEIAAAAAIAIIAAAGYVVTLRVANDSHLESLNELLRASLLVIAIAHGSAVVFALASRRKNTLRNRELARVNAELSRKDASARETDERFRLMFHGNPPSDLRL